MILIVMVMPCFCRVLMPALQTMDLLSLSSCLDRLKASSCSSCNPCCQFSFIEKGMCDGVSEFPDHFNWAVAFSANKCPGSKVGKWAGELALRLSVASEEEYGVAEFLMANVVSPRGGCLASV